MANEDFKVRLVAEDKITPAAKKAGDALDDLADKADTKLKLDADVSKALAALDEVAAEAKATAEAADALGKALGPELAAKADTTAIVGDLKNMGVTLDQIKGNADEFGAKMRELSDIDVGGKLGSSLGTARGKTDELGKSADSSKSVLANMVGNSVQDLGALSGVAGSAGVAIGQMGEYIADAKAGGDSFKQIVSGFGAVAGPIAAITVATSALGSIFKAAGDRAARAKEQVQAFTGALKNTKDATSAVEGLSDQLLQFDADARTAWGGFVEGAAAAARAIPLIGGLVGDAGQNISNIIPTLNAVGISAKDIGRAAAEGGSAWDQLQVKLWGSQEIGLITADQYAAASQALYGFRDSAEAATIVNEFLGVSTEDSGKAAEDSTGKWDAFTESIEAYALKVQQAQGDLKAMTGAFETLGGKQDALSALFTLGNAPEVAAGQVRDVKIAIGELDTALEGIDVADVLAGDIKADKFLDAIDAIAPDIQAQITDTFAASGPAAAVAMANSYIDQVTKELGGKFTREQVAKMLGLEDIEVKILAAVDLDSIAKARAQLDILTGLTGEDAFTASVKLALDAGTITGEQAQTLIQEKLGEQGVEIPSTLRAPNTEQALAEANAALAGGATMTVNAETQAAIDAAEAAQLYADSLVGTETVDGQWEMAQAAADAAKTYADGLIAQETIDADNKAAIAAADAAKEHADELTASLEILGVANTAQAEREIANLTRDRTVTVRVRGIPEAVEMGGTVGPDGGIAGEAGPEFIRLPDGRKTLLTGPTLVPPRTQVTSTKRTRALLSRGQLPLYAAGTATGGDLRVAVIWEQILRGINQLASMTEAGNETTEQLNQAMHAAVELDELGVEEANRIAVLLEALNEEMQKGTGANQEAIDGLKSALSVAVRDATAPVAAATDAAAPAEVVKAVTEAAKAKEDPNTAILEKISGTLLDTLSHDRTALAMLLGEIKFLIQTVQAGGDPAAAVRAATMAIHAGAA